MIKQVNVQTGEVIEREPTLEELKTMVSVPTLEQVKELKQSEVRNDFNNAINQPVQVNSISYNGGYESAMKLDAAMRLAQTAGKTTVTFYDIDNEEHELSITDATTVTLTVADDYQTKLAKKQELMRQIKNASTVEELELIGWSE